MASRRDFLTAFKKPLEKVVQQKEEVLYVRPPYSKGESTFETLCLSCESKACATSCEEKIIVINAQGSPILNFKERGCTFCEACALSCESEVLSLENLETSEVINAKFVISVESCAAHNEVICFSCKEPCIDDAILFTGMFNPVIDMDICTGCGFCLSRCPTSAITYKPTKIKEEKVA
jgi:ferredoxin-type protein NapF